MDAVTGCDGQKRVFVLKSKRGILKRPIQKLYPLEVSSNEIEIVNDFRTKQKKRHCKNENVNKNDECILSDDSQNKCEENIVTTRSGRISRKPTRFSN